mmetsp:Transcript_42225/g.106504  ORF Transcript_42225/g.106504 Transcript_42225/m.106504 type:complete len:254 (+) Transcript_42225:1321-2082(+)
MPSMRKKVPSGSPLMLRKKRQPCMLSRFRKSGWLVSSSERRYTSTATPLSRKRLLLMSTVDRNSRSNDSTCVPWLRARLRWKVELAMTTWPSSSRRACTPALFRGTSLAVKLLPATCTPSARVAPMMLCWFKSNTESSTCRSVRPSSVRHGAKLPVKRQVSIPRRLRCPSYITTTSRVFFWKRLKKSDDSPQLWRVRMAWPGPVKLLKSTCMAVPLATMSTDCALGDVKEQPNTCRSTGQVCRPASRLSTRTR